MTQRNRRGPLRALLAVCLVLTALVFALRTGEAAESACAAARRHLPAALGLDVGIGRCELDPLTQTVTLHGVSLFEPGADTPIVAADRAEVSFGSLRPLTRVLELDRVELVRPRVTLDLQKPSSGGGGGGGCSLEPLRRLDIARLDIRNAEVRLLLPEGRAVELLDGEVTWRRRRGRAEIHLQATRGGFVAAPGVELELATLSVDARFDQANERVEVTQAELELEGFSLTGAGDIRRLCDPVLALEAGAFVPVQTVARVLGADAATTDGHLWARLSVTGEAKAPEVGFELAGSEVRLGRYLPGTFDVSGRLSGDVVAVDALQTQVGQGAVRAQGRLQLVKGLPLSLSAEIDGAELGPALARSGLPGAWVNFPSTGRAKISGTLLPAPQLSGDFDLKTGHFVLATQSFERPYDADRVLLEFAGASVQGELHVLPDRVDLLQVRAFTERSSTLSDVSLHYDPDKGLLIRGEAPELDFGDFGHIAGIEWSGRASGDYLIEGPYTDVKIGSQLSARDFEMWLFALGQVQGRVEFEGDTLSFLNVSGQQGRLPFAGNGALVFGKDGLHTRAQAVVAKGPLADLVDVLAPMHPNMDHFMDGTLTGEVAGRVEIDSPADAFAGTVTLQVEDTRYFDRGLGDADVVLRFLEGDRMVLDRTVFEGALGRTEVAGTWFFDGPLDYRFRIDGSLAEAFGAESAKALELDGKLSVRGTVGGDTDVWTVDAWVTSPQISLAGRSLGRSHLEARMVGRDFQVWGAPFQGSNAKLELTVREPYPWKLATRVTLPELRTLLPEAMAQNGVTGTLTGEVDARGDLQDSRKFEGRAKVERLSLSRGDFTAVNEEPVVLSWRAGRLEVESFAFRGPDTRLTVTGSAGPKALDLRLLGNADVRLVESFVPWFERTGGRIEVSAVSGGTFDAPTFAGTAQLSGVRFGLRELPVTVRGLSGRVDFSEKRIVAQSVRGALNDGRIDVEADVRLDKQLAPRDLQLRALLDEVSYRVAEGLPVTVSGEVNLAGKPDDLTLAGNVDILRLRYDQPLVIEDLLGDLRGGRLGGTAAGAAGEVRKEWLHYDVLVKASGDVRVDNNLARARLGGDVRLTGSNLRPGLVGLLEAHEGSEIFFRGNTFQVSQALVEFKDRREIDPVIDLHAQSQVREYLVALHAFGRLKDPQLVLTADPDLAEADVLALLTLGVTSRDRSDAMGTAALMGAGEALYSAVGLDRQVQRFLPRNPLLRDLSFHISSTYNEASGGVEPTAHLETRLLALPLELAMTQPVVTTRGTRARLEYRFDERLSGQLQWDDDRNEALPNFGLDLKLRWEVK